MDKGTQENLIYYEGGVATTKWNIFIGSFAHNFQ